MNVRDAIGREWLDRLTDDPIGLGLDVGTTEKGTSNPSSLTVTQRTRGLYIQRLVVCWKSENDLISKAVVRTVVDDILSAGRRPRRLGVDASSEVYFAREVQRMLIGRVPVELVKSGAKIEWKGGEYLYKVLLGNIYTALFEDNLIALAPAKWVGDDHRLVKREKGSFAADLGDWGEHGDTFDSGKLSVWALESGRSSFTAEAAAVGAMGGGEAGENRPRGPLGKLTEKVKTLLAT